MHYWEAFERLRGVRDELIAARFATGLAIRAVDTDASILAGIGEPLKPSQLRECGANLELTYLFRLFAEFEGILRNYWATVRPRPVPRRTKMEILMNRVSVECQIPFDIALDAHEVREYRNRIAHERQLVGPLSFDECKSRLGFFLAYLPRRW